jgi:hypothetical protein
MSLSKTHKICKTPVKKNKKLQAKFYLNFSKFIVKDQFKEPKKSSAETSTKEQGS